MSSRRICTFYAQGNCRRGNNCTFLHQGASPRASSPATPATPTTPTSLRGRGNSVRSRGTGSPRSTGTAPRQVCNIFWQSGKCDRGFDCTFKHTRGPQALNQETPSSDTPNEEPAEFYSIEGLAESVRPPQLPLATFDPSEVHNHIKPFLKDNYTFEGPMNVQSFVRIISSVHERNKAWVRFPIAVESESGSTYTWRRILIMRR